ncbi:hypothetical protein SAMN05192529_102139 [Arachidicoccus rhizosphaerae]|uniref:DUF3168 domain-containing protein n=1 Tax=Arachidicoccus rhizosphaerae TaxID=551991 RepID=A0A1H3W4X8_9BACT|nr:hypothetical protein [Arachidicoccus rhizosphaerae]SDZ82179.1 hypothetical protein SAMN05192529_102139 [Arachidicoccus rhizosphaerae]
MIDADYKLRTEYYRLLNGNVKYLSNNVPVFDDYANISTPAPYVVIAGINGNDGTDKVHFGHNLTVTVDIVTEFDKGSTDSRYQCDMISGEVTKILLPKVACGSNFNLFPDFQSISAKRVNSQSLTEESDTKKVYRKVIQISHTIKQLSDG